MKTHKILLILFLFTLLPLSAQAKTDIEIILDLSGSMRQVAGGEAQIDSARKALLNSIKGIPSGTLVALRAYGHRVEQSNKTDSCRDTELLIPFGPVNLEQFKEKGDQFSPKGYTPIAYSLEQSKNDFDLTREAEKVIILLSDGEETCDGDPIAVLKKLKEEGFKVKVHTVGFNVDQQTRQQLESISNFTGGTYFNAQGAEGLNKALEEATQEAVVIEKEKTTYGQAIRGGNSYETAVPIEFDIEYKLDHHQKKNDFDYFVLSLKPGQQLVVELKTLEKGVHIKEDGGTNENDNPYAGLELHDDGRNKIRHVNIIGDRNRTETISHIPSQEGKYTILVGSTYESMNKDHVTFKLTKEVKGDLGSDKDAGDSAQTAPLMEPGRYPVNYIGGGDVIDIFSFKGKKGEKVAIGVIPNQEFGSYFKVEINDDYKQRILSEMGGGGQGKKTQFATIPNDGTYFVSIQLGTSTKDALSYTIELIKEETAATHE